MWSFEGLKRGEPDLQICREKPDLDGFESCRLLDETCGVYGPSNWRRKSLATLVARGALLIHFHHRDQIAHRLLRQAKIKKLDEIRTKRVGHIDLMLSQVADGLGFAALSQEFVEKSRYAADVTLLAPVSIRLPVYAAWPKARYHSLLLQELVKGMRRMRISKDR